MCKPKTQVRVSYNQWQHRRCQSRSIDEGQDQGQGQSREGRPETQPHGDGLNGYLFIAKLMKYLKKKNKRSKKDKEAIQLDMKLIC